MWDGHKHLGRRLPSNQPFKLTVARTTVHVTCIHAMSCNLVHVLQEREEAQKLRQALAARDRALSAATAAVDDAQRASAPREARLAAAQAALQQREADFQALRTSLRAKENEVLSLEVRLATQTTRLADLELAGREAAAAAAAAHGREEALTERVAELEAQCAVAEETAVRRMEDTVAAALDGVAAQIADSEVRDGIIWGCQQVDSLQLQKSSCTLKLRSLRHF